VPIEDPTDSRAGYSRAAILGSIYPVPGQHLRVSAGLCPKLHPPLSRTFNQDGRLLALIVAIISVTGIISAEAAIVSIAGYVPVTITTPRGMAPLIPGVIALVGVGISEPRAIIVPVMLLVPSTVLIGLLFQTPRVARIQDAI